MVRFGILFVATNLLYAADSALTVEDAIRLAIAHNASVQINASQVRLAEEEAKQQRGAMLPSLNLNSDLSRPGPNMRLDPWLNAASRSQFETIWRTSLQAKWVIFDGGGNSNQLESRRILVDAAKEREQSTKESVAASVAMAYWELVKQNQLLGLARESREYSNERLRIAQARRAMGSASLIEEQQAMLDRNADSASELRQAAAQKQARGILNWWIGKPIEDSIAVLDSLDELAYLASPSQTPMRKVGEVPQIREAELRGKAAKVATQSLRGEWFPEVSLYANYNFLEQYSDKPPPDNGHYQGMLYGVQLTLPLFEGGKSVARIMAAQETEHIQTLETRAMQEMWAKDVALAQAQRSYAGELAVLELGNVSLADSLYKASLGQFELGSLSGVDLRRVQLARTEARERLVLVNFNAKIAEIQVNLLLTGALP